MDFPVAAPETFTLKVAVPVLSIVMKQPRSPVAPGAQGPDSHAVEPVPVAVLRVRPEVILNIT